MKHRWFSFAAILVLLGQLLVGLPSGSATGVAAAPPPPDSPLAEVQDQVKAAIEQALVARQDEVLAYVIYQAQVERVQVSADGRWAYAMLVLTDPQTDEILPSEPGLAFARLQGGQWIATLPSDPEWPELLQSAPADLLREDLRQVWWEMYAAEQANMPEVPLTGYLLPWRAGETVYLSRSVAHDEDIPSGSAHYSFDFYISGTMWPVHAAKGGTVWRFQYDVPTCYERHCDDQTIGNYLVIRDATTNPVSYQLYLHLAQDSIPPELREVGAPVVRGQFIGIADNTGQSWGHHLHFQVHTNPDSYWGYAVDIKFNDVSINDGRPRRHDAVYDDFPWCWESDVCEQGQAGYVSQNVPPGDLAAPMGDLVNISNGDVITTTILPLEGWAYDAESGVDYGEVIINYNDTWLATGLTFTSIFTGTLDLCTPGAAVPDGPLSVALRIYDMDGNFAPMEGLRTVIKAAACPQPPPDCVPAVDQVALFADADFGGGCMLLEAGDYPAMAGLGMVGDNDTASILVGSNLIATLYSELDYDGHAEVLTGSDSNLKDNALGAEMLSSLHIALSDTLPLTPTLLSPAESQAIFEEGDLLPLSWLNGGGALEYQVWVTGGLTTELTSTWQADAIQYLGGLAEGDYTWQVRGRNSAGESPWSEVLTFTVGAAGALPPAVSLPYEADMEAQDDWSGSGHWSWVNDADRAHSGTHSWWYPGSGDYDDGQPNFGILESPPISMTDTGYYLRFWYRYETEAYGANWDQRWLQIAVDGQPFTNVLQLRDDPMIPEINVNTWLQSPALDLSAYAGHTIRLRFLFNTVDATNNAYDGWGIDDVSITDTPPPDCTDLLQDDTPAQATLLAYNVTLTTTAEICPGGDLDYYKFNAAAGDRIAVDIDANDDGSPLDPYLVLFDSDGISVLAERDDEVYAVRRDPLLGFTLPHAGLYYLAVRAWNHPSVGGQDYDYSIRLFADAEPPQVEVTWPESQAILPDAPFTITAQVTDDVEIHRLEFFWHSTDWLAGVWMPLETDWDGSDGWAVVFDPAGQLEGLHAAVYASAYDMAGNWMAAGSWELVIDKTAPESSMEPITPTQSSTAFVLTWAGSDNLTGVDYYELQQRLDGGAWTDYPVAEPISEYVESMWYIGEAGHSYEFRLRGVDHAGNVESYPATAEVATTIPVTDVLCAEMDVYDAAGGDNSPATAVGILADGTGQWHNFCNPLTPDALYDEDWITFTVQTGERYLIQSFPTSAATATVLDLYANDGTTRLATASPTQFGEFVNISWESDRDGFVYLRVSHLDGRVIGSEVAYQIVIWGGYRTFMPIAAR